ncbi:hypothetical protein BDQ12DRAFT_652502 [Crucibulum laeve]|uniref:Heme haloperoxidase family profile domain-containing protein n=1 Tax=Crucibulum laeve TaxID=68775 RepID=A0A5C3LZI5_9AGAR|nr:hypothetical protein BDQ12DRAFT_652502 [Crucibulum laeve]
MSPLQMNNVFHYPTTSDSRSPCPALNTLANHGYIRRSGTQITLFVLTRTLVHVYNVSFLLAFILAFTGFITCGTFRFEVDQMNDYLGSSTRRKSLSVFPRLLSCVPRLRWTLDLADLSKRGPLCIAHNGSLVHPDSVSSSAPDPTLVKELLHYANLTSACENAPIPGLSLVNLARFHSQRVASSETPLNKLHKHISRSESALLWALMHDRAEEDEKLRDEDSEVPVIPLSRLEQWLGQERLPDGWWDEGGVRPVKTVGLRDARRQSNVIQALIDGHF